ncbi:centromere protein W isoform X1 [Tamandua tetradactyla]|uniref:centromere protein W isoform X1 n=1 Tax=Tamandua tetradactyla TaxID=48850 RepID=UPI00405485DD
MALTTTVRQRKQIRRKAPRGFLRRVFKRQKPQLRLETRGDLLVSCHPSSGGGPSPGLGPQSCRRPTRKAFPAVIRTSELFTVYSSISRRVQEKCL